MKVAGARQTPQRKLSQNMNRLPMTVAGALKTALQIMTVAILHQMPRRTLSQIMTVGRVSQSPPRKLSQMR